MNNKTFIALCFLAFLNTSNAQPPSPQLPTVLPPTPEAAAITKNAELSVGLFSGAAQISVPMYEIKLSDFKLPVSLNYAGGGLKVDEIPSRTGLGWSLSAGGVITRIVNGKPDDLSTRYLPSFSLNQSLQSLTYYYDLSAEDAPYDAEPDEFRIAAPGLSGKFVLDSDNNPVIIPFANYKIQMNGLQPYIEIIITNTEGVKYYFGGSAIEMTTNHSIGGKLEGLTQITTGFFLRKIETPNKDSINFYYSMISTRQYTGVTHMVSIAAGLYDYVGVCDQSEMCDYGGTTFGEQVSDVSYNSLLLDSIKSSIGDRLTFSYEARPDNGGDKRLINVFVYESSKTKKYTLLYETPSTASYTAHTMGNYNKRFFLKELWTQASNDTLKHKFGYIDLNGLPPRLSYAQDHYGFFNGIDNQNLLPANYAQTAYGSFGSYANANRNSDGNYAQKGMLNKITYSTGGYDSIIYEPNRTSVTTPVLYTASGIVSGQGSGATGVNTYTSSTCMNTLRDHSAKLYISASVSPSCTSCTPPAENDHILEVRIKNITDNIDIATRFVTSFGNTAEDISLLANKCYKIELKVRGDYSYGQVELDYDISAQQTYNTVWYDAPGIRVKQVRSDDQVTGVPNNKFYKYTYASNLNGSSATALLGLTYFSHSYRKRICTVGAPPPGSYIICYWDVLSSNSNSYQYLDNNMFGYSAVLESDDPNFVNGLTEHIYQVGPYLAGTSILGDDLRGVPTNTLSWFNGYETSTRYYNSAFNLVKSIDNYFHVDTAVNKILQGVIVKRKYDDVLPPDNPVYPDEIDPYVVTQYMYQSNWIKHDSTVTKEYDSYNHLLSSKLTNYYGPPANILPVRIENYNSKGQLVKEERKYPTDYSGQSPYQRMINKNIISSVIESKSYVNNNLTYTTKTNYYDFSQDTLSSSPVIIKPQTIQVQKGAGPLETRIRFYKYDTKGSPVEMSKENDIKLAYIWDYGKNYPIAEIKNADSSSVAYTSFEADGKGNWNNYSGTVTVVNTAPFPPTGKKYYNLTTSATLSKAVTNGAVYIISYWRNNTSPYSITGGTSAVQSGITIGGWTYHEHRVTATSSTLTISGTGGIDEVRLYPEKAQMTTYTYEPLVGITSEADINNRINYYEYDAFGRLNLIRDMYGNIVKTINYHYKNIPVN